MEQRKELIYAAAVLLGFVLPWVSWGFISFKGYQVPNMIADIGDLSDILSSSTFNSKGSILLAYSIYLIPILTIISIVKYFKKDSPKATLNYLVLYVIIACIYSLSLYGELMVNSADIGIYLIVISTIIYAATLYGDRLKFRNKSSEFRIDNFQKD